MAAKKKEATAPVVEVAPATITVPTVDLKAVGRVVAWAERERRSTAAVNEAERALSVLVRTADEIVTQAGDIATDAHSGSPIERERHAKKIARAVESLEKVRSTVAELAAA
jgi:hypothetical protein